MKNFFIQLRYLAEVHILGLCGFTFFRIVEYVALSARMSSGSAAAVLPAFLRGVWFDNVTACYIMALPLVVLLLCASFGYYAKWLRRSVSVWLCSLYALSFAASAGNIPYFAFFVKNINSSIFEWFGYAGTTAGMVTGEKSYWLYILIYLLFTGAFVFSAVRLRQRADAQTVGPDARGLWPAALRLFIFVSAAGLTMFGIRGRTGYNPIKISEAYYCDDPFLNQLGINPMFNLLTSVMDDMRSENRPLDLMPVDEALERVSQWYGFDVAADSACLMRRGVTCEGDVKRRNVVFILMESMSASFMEYGGNEEHLTPVLDSLFNCSLSFSEFYSSGIHTNQGLTSTLYSFPALMKRNLMKGTVTPHRDGIPTVLKEHGYHNMFFMTHEAQYDNMNAFFRTNGYDEIYSQEDYPRSERVNAFGVPDHFLFSYALPVIGRAAEGGSPFMATLLTISNHPPYELPEWFDARSSEPEKQIVEYADYCVGRFLREASREPWFENTIFVIQADHGKLVGKVDAELPESYNHIPLIIFGPGVSPMVYDGLGQQVDVMPTLLGLMNMGYDYDGFGVDLLSRRRDMVFYSADNQIVGRDSLRCFVHTPSLKRDFCYRSEAGGRLVPVPEDSCFVKLRDFSFAVLETAQLKLREQRQSVAGAVVPR